MMEPPQQPVPPWTPRGVRLETWRDRHTVEHMAEELGIATRNKCLTSSNKKLLEASSRNRQMRDLHRHQGTPRRVAKNPSLGSSKDNLETSLKPKFQKHIGTHWNLVHANPNSFALRVNNSCEKNVTISVLGTNAPCAAWYR